MLSKRRWPVERGKNTKPIAKSVKSSWEGMKREIRSRLIDKSKPIN